MPTMRACAARLTAVFTLTVTGCSASPSASHAQPAISRTPSALPTPTAQKYFCSPKSAVAEDRSTFTNDLNAFAATPRDGLIATLEADSRALRLAIVRRPGAEAAALGTSVRAQLRAAAYLVSTDLKAVRADENMGNTPIFGTLLADAQNFSDLLNSTLPGPLGRTGRPGRSTSDRMRHIGGGRLVGEDMDNALVTKHPKLRLYSAITLAAASMALGAVPFVTEGLTRGVSWSHGARVSALPLFLVAAAITAETIARPRTGRHGVMPATG
jgi:hypothetical protein